MSIPENLPPVSPVSPQTTAVASSDQRLSTPAVERVIEWHRRHDDVTRHAAVATEATEVMETMEATAAPKVAEVPSVKAAAAGT